MRMSSNDPSANGSDGHLPEPIATGHASIGDLTPFKGQVRHDLAHPMASRPAVLSTAPNALTLLKALRRRWLLATCLALPFAAAVFMAVWLFLPPAKATVSAKVDIPPNYKPILGQNGTMGRESPNTQAETIRVKSSLVLNAALNDPEVVKANPSVLHDRDTLSWLDQEIKVDFPAGPEILRVSMVGDETEELVILVNAVVGAYIREFQSNHNSALKDRIGRLETIHTKYQNRVEVLEKRQNELAVLIGAGDNKSLAIKQALALDWLRHEQRELFKLHDERSLRVRELHAYEQITEGGDIDLGVIDKQINSKPEIIELRKQEDFYNGLIERTKQEAADGENNPVVKEHTRKRDGIKNQIDNLRKQQRPVIEKELRARAEVKLLNIREQIEELEALIKAQQQNIETLAKDAEVANKNGIGLESVSRELKLANRSLTRVADTLEALKMEEDAPPSALLLEKASVLRADELPRKLRFAGISAAGAIALVLLLVAFLEFRSRRIDSVDEVVHGLGLRLMGTLPANPARIHQRLLAPTSHGAEWGTLLAESVDSARTMLLHEARSSGLRVVMVTSAVGGEGKTSLATHLAASLARAGRKTLLLDCDLRNPAAHGLFDLPLEPGFSELLRGEASVAEALRPTAAANLWMITAGQCDAAALHLLAQVGPQKIFHQLRQEFDFLIVDSSPILPVADSLLFAEHVDGVLFAILREVSRLPNVYAAYQRLAMLGAPIVGAVVNGTLDHQYSYGSRTVSVAGV
jgi:capsular exopolysaccharide synthesis family protein